MLKYIDIYGRPLNLNVKNAYKFNTNFGGILSMLSFLILGIFLYEFSKGMIFKDKPYISYS